MEKGILSIFNDVIGPVLSGPSSSHTAGPVRIGKMLRMILGDDVKKATITFEEKGSYPSAYRGQGSDRGFVGGLLGFDTSDNRLKRALDIAKERGFEVNFKKDDIGNTHPNAALIELISVTGNRVCALTHSTGGGTFKIVKIEGVDVDIKGDWAGWLILVQNDNTTISKIDKCLKNIDKNDCTVKKNISDENIIYEIVEYKSLPDDVREIINNLPNITWCRRLDPVLPVKSFSGMKVPYSTATEALEYANKNDITTNNLGIHYEMNRSGMSYEEVINYMIEIMDVMKHSVYDSIAGNISKRDYLDLKVKLMNENIKKKNIVNVGVMNKVMIWATAVMEYNNSLGVIVAAPTAGSCGVLPASIIAVGKDMGKSDEEIALAMLTAGVIGVFIANQATFAAEVCACQAENGSASAMAAAGIVALLGGSVEEAFMAASLALQNLLGLVCDPIAGSAGIPCINRNTTAANNAIASANMVICGFDPVIPLDETIKSMWDVGNMLPMEFRCTGKGGLCTTPTGLRLAKEMNEKYS